MNTFAQNQDSPSGASAQSLVPLSDQLTWSASEAAKMCGFSVSTFHDWVRRGLMPRPIPKTKRYSAAAVRECAIRANGYLLERAAPDKALDTWRAERD